MREIFNSHIIKIKKLMCMYVLFPIPLKNKCIVDFKNLYKCFQKNSKGFKPYYFYLRNLRSKIFYKL